MKKEYSTPIVEKIAFNYRDQVVAASSNDEYEENGSGGAKAEWSSRACRVQYYTEWIQIISGCVFD